MSRFRHSGPPRSTVRPTRRPARRARLALAAWLAAACATACGDRAATGASARSGPGTDERPAVTLTRWTERTELFVESPALVAGATSRAAIHVTDLSDFKPLASGEAVVVLRSEDGREREFRGGRSRPGIFGVDVEPDRAGRHTMTLRIEAPHLNEVHEIGAVMVHAPGSARPDANEGAGESGGSHGDAPHDHRGERASEGDAISFLKEQQWALEFGTVAVESRELRASFTVPAVVQARAGGDAVVAAPVPGRIDPAAAAPLPGTRVRAGAVLARIVPGSDDLRDAAGLRAAVVEAERQDRLARQDRERVARLLEARAIPARRLEEADAAVAVSEARLEAARLRWSRYESVSQSGAATSGEGAFIVRAPFDGVVAEVRFAPGSSVEENETLLRVVDADRAHVVGAVPEARAAALASIERGELLRNGESPVPLGKPLAIGRVVEPATRTAEVRFALDNREHRWPIGQSAVLRLFAGGAQSGPAVPESAVVDDGGRPVVFVQTGGESFERRPVRLGSREAGRVLVLEGVAPGERVVHRGAYLIRLAAMSTQIPAHGHVH